MAVKGLDVFREHFAGVADRYVLIGTTACDLVMREAGLEFRATKDLDIVLCVEALDREFAELFWAFVREGGYVTQEASSGARRFYRFQKPSAAGYPFMLELFSRVPDALTVAEGSHLTPVPIADEVSSLSAILSGTKVVHHLLPDLVPPMDRRYTIRFFFGYDGPNSGEGGRFVEMLRRFNDVARRCVERIEPRLGRGMHTSRSKVLDNAVVGYVLADVRRSAGAAQ